MAKTTITVPAYIKLVNNSDKVVITAVNNTPEERMFTPVIAGDYRVEYIHGTPGSIPGNSGVILLLTKK